MEMRRLSSERADSIVDLEFTLAPHTTQILRFIQSQRIRPSGAEEVWRAAWARSAAKPCAR